MYFLIRGSAFTRSINALSKGVFSKQEGYISTKRTPKSASVRSAQVTWKTENEDMKIEMVRVNSVGPPSHLTDDNQLTKIVTEFFCKILITVCMRRRPRSVVILSSRSSCSLMRYTYFL